MWVRVPPCSPNSLYHIDNARSLFYYQLRIGGVDGHPAGDGRSGPDEPVGSRERYSQRGVGIKPGPILLSAMPEGVDGDLNGSTRALCTRQEI